MSNPHPQRPSGMPCHRYRPFPPVDLPDRQWPSRSITAAPRWLSTDLRDGNQALIDPMNAARKHAMFDLLVRMGYKEIEVGFPAASQTDFDFVRSLIEGGKVPDDVRISVLTQARDELIERTVQSLVGASNATVHMYNAAAPVFRRVVFGFAGDGRAECRAVAVDGIQAIMKYADVYLPGTEFGLEYSPEIFMDTELDFSLEICEGVMDVWQPAARSGDRAQPAVHCRAVDAERLRRPDRVDVATPQPTRARLPVGAHPQRPRHRDRRRRVGGAGGRAAHRGLPVRQRRAQRQRRPGDARAEPVQPGRRSDDRLQRHRRDPAHRRVLQPHRRAPSGTPTPATWCTRPSPARTRTRSRRASRTWSAPAARRQPVSHMPWQMPYLPIDPKDVGRSYEAVIRVNSQSGKGGVAYIMKADHHLDLPRRLQIEFSHVIQRHTDGEGGEVNAVADVADLRGGVPRARSVRTRQVQLDQRRGHRAGEHCRAGRRSGAHLSGVGNGPIAAFCEALSTADLGLGGAAVRVLDYAEHALSSGRDAEAAAYLEIEIGDRVLWGVGISESIVQASLRGVISALNREARTRTAQR